MVEVWLQRLVDGMQGTVKNIIKRASRNVQEMRLEDFIFSHPAQIALLGIQFQWTADTQVPSWLSSSLSLLQTCSSIFLMSVNGHTYCSKPQYVGLEDFKCSLVNEPSVVWDLLSRKVVAKKKSFYVSTIRLG